MRTLPPSKARISPAREDYIRAIYLLQEKGEEPGIIQIAKRLNLSKSTVSERIKELTEDGLTISKPYSTISLTPQGAALGKKMTYKHRLIEVFLHQTLKLPKDKIIYTYCAVGYRSSRAGKIIAKQKFDVRPLKPGFEELVKAGFDSEKK